MSTQVIRFLQQENARLQKENETQREQILSLNRCIEALIELYWAIQQVTAEKNLLDMFDRRLYDMMHAIGAKDSSLLCLDEETGELVFTVVHGELRRQLAGHRIKGDQGVTGWVVENGQPAIVNNPRQDWRFSLQADEEFAFLIHSILCVPVMRQGRPVGVIELLNKERQEFTEVDAILALVLGHLAAITLAEMQSRSETVEIEAQVST